MGHTDVSTLNLISGQDLLEKLNREKQEAELKKLKTRQAKRAKSYAPKIETCYSSLQGYNFDSPPNTLQTSSFAFQNQPNGPREDDNETRRVEEQAVEHSNEEEKEDLPQITP